MHLAPAECVCESNFWPRWPRLLFGGAGACAHTDYFPGTTILRNEDNIKIIETVEQYRRRMLEHNVEGLLVLASQTYFEDSGTPRSDDDYGFEGLKQVLARPSSRWSSRCATRSNTATST